jgi:hypothetical protein
MALAFHAPHWRMALWNMPEREKRRLSVNRKQNSRPKAAILCDCNGGDISNEGAIFYESG